MRTTPLIALALCLAIVSPEVEARPKTVDQLLVLLNGDPTFLGAISATTTKNNHTTAVPFSNTGTGLAGKTLLLQPDTAGYLLCGSANTAAVTSANGIKINADERVIISLSDTNGWCAWLASTGTSILRVWELK